MTSMDAVQDFLAQRKIAMVGVSRDEKDFSRAVYRQLRGSHDLVPVHAEVDEIEGDPTVRSVDALPADIDGILVMTSPERTDEVVEAAIEAGIPRVWLFKGAGKGSVTDHAVALCVDHGIEVIDGQCPLMFAEPVATFHKVHAFGKKVAHTYPI